jgi:hypothetical protein
MKVFVWHVVDKCSDAYHSGGGVVVFAENEIRARQIANAISGCSIRDDETPSKVADCEDGPEQVFIMADAGCC